MPCPFFEPVLPVSGNYAPQGRLPLIQEYEGRCARHAGSLPVNSRCCNQGYARGSCEFFPSDDANRANRYSLLKREEQGLTLLFIGEEEYSPATSRMLHFSIAEDRLIETDVDSCVLAQAVAFCRSYLRLTRQVSG
ncbi:MAG TPA: hypothetical protein VF023_11770 [Bryobacteraceae bacterium]|jgi:hypothetical protein